MFDSILSAKSRNDMLAIVEACIKAKTLEYFSEKVLYHSQHLLGQEMTACGVGEIGSMKVISTHNAGFPTEFLNTIVDNDGYCRSPLCRRWLTCQTPQALEPKRHKDILTRDEVELYKSFHISNVLSHGAFDLVYQYTTYFGFAQIKERINRYHVNLINFLVPHLHVCYSRIAYNLKKPALTKHSSHLPRDYHTTKCGTTISNNQEIISRREHEVLRWLLDGKSNWEIGRILNISEYTVKNHVQKIIKKLNANSRQHAVAKALAEGLIQL